MTGAADLERLLQDVQQMDRPDLIALLKAIPCPFPIDFSDTYLAEVPLDRLKHLVLAVCLHVRRATPTSPTTVPTPAASAQVA